MKVSIIKIGNSRGIRLPKALLEQCNINDDLEITVKNGTIILSPCKKVRSGWKESFEMMAKNGDDVLLDADIFPDDTQDWEW